MRKKIVAGNWKMNNNLDEGLKLTSEISNMVADELNDDVQVILAPPFIHLAAVGKIVQDNDKIAVAAQNCSEHDKGAYTGEISAGMIKSVKAAYVILGHSERREQFKETEAQLAAKVDKVLAEGLLPIFCCGESLEIRESGKHEAYVCEQITKSLYHLSEADFSKIIIAYEPIWAIGTGKTASPEQAQEMHAAIRKHIAKQYGNNIAENTSVLYGGSCKPDNAKTIFSQTDVDGGLIGGASLKSRDFMDIIKSF